MKNARRAVGGLSGAAACLLMIVLAAAASAQQPEHDPSNSDGAADQAEPAPDAPLQLRARADPNEIVIEGSQSDMRPDQIPSVDAERRERRARYRCGIAMEAGRDGDPMRPQMETAADSCPRR